MNIRSSRPALFAPALTVLLAGALSIPRSLADCCAGRGGGGAFAGSNGSAHGSLQEVFGGSPTRTILLQNNSPNQSVTVKYGPRSVSLVGGESKRRDFGGSDASSGSVGPLAGEGVAATLSGSSGNSGTTPTVSLSEEDQCPPKVAYDSTGTTGWEPLEKRITLTIPAVNATTTGPLVRTPVSARGEGNADVPSLVDLNDFGYGGAVVTPGAVSLDGSSNIVVSNTGVLVAASLGPSTDGGSGRLGYIIPTTGTGGVYNFVERISYLVRGVDLSTTTYTNGSGAGSVTRYKTVNGMAELTQTTLSALTFKFYSTGAFSATSPYAPNGGATPVRSMVVERLAAASSPDSNVYKCGSKVTTSRPGRADDVKTMWFNECDATVTGATNSGGSTTFTVGVGSAQLLSGFTKVAVTGSTDTSLNGTWDVTSVNTTAPGTVVVSRSGSVGSFGSPKLKAGILSASTSLSNKITITTSATVPTAASPVRTVDTTVTENFHDASSGTVTSGNVTLTSRYRDSIRSLSDGEEQIESHKVFLTDNTTAPSLTTTYDYFPDSADAINRRTLHRRVEATGKWDVHFQYDSGAGVSDSVTLSGWKDQAAPAVSAVDTNGEIWTLIYSSGYNGSYRLTDSRGQLSYAEERANNYFQSSTEDPDTDYGVYDAYPYARVSDTSAGPSGTDYFDTYTYEVGWDSANPTSTAAESVAPELRHRQRDTYRFKRRTSATSPESVTAAINTAKVTSHTHYRYLSADASTGFPGYGTPVAWTSSGAYEITDVVEDVLHLPSPMTRTVTERATGRTVTRERYMVTAVNSTTKDPSSLEVLEQEWTSVDSQGRPVSITANGSVVETWAYPADDTVEHKDRSGAVFVTKYTPGGRIIYTARQSVAGMSFVLGGTTYTSASQSAIFTEYTYAMRTPGGSQFGLYDRTTTTVARTGNTLISDPVEDDVGAEWRRSSIEGFDGAGRLVYSLNGTGQENAIAHPTDQAISPITTRRLGGSAASGTILEQTETYKDGRLKVRSGAAIITEYADYVAATYMMTSYSSPYSPATGGNSVTVDAQGRTVGTSTKTPSVGPRL